MARAARGAAEGAVKGGVNGAAAYSMAPGPYTVIGFAESVGGQATVGALTGGTTAYRLKWLDKGTGATFSHGIYRSGYSQGDTLLSRAGTEGPRKEWGVWSRDAPTSVAQVREDKSILPVWGDVDGNVTGTSPLKHGYTANFRPVRPMGKGRVAAQVGDDGHVYVGGTQQVHIPQSCNHGSIVDKWEIS